MTTWLIGAYALLSIAAITWAALGGAHTFSGHPRPPGTKPEE